jgi:hypothetical protein
MFFVGLKRPKVHFHEDWMRYVWLFAYMVNIICYILGEVTSIFFIIWLFWRKKIILQFFWIFELENYHKLLQLCTTKKGVYNFSFFIFSISPNLAKYSYGWLASEQHHKFSEKKILRWRAWINVIVFKIHAKFQQECSILIWTKYHIKFITTKTCVLRYLILTNMIVDFSFFYWHD